ARGGGAGRARRPGGARARGGRGEGAVRPLGAGRAPGGAAAGERRCDRRRGETLAGRGGHLVPRRDRRRQPAGVPRPPGLVRRRGRVADRVSAMASDEPLQDVRVVESVRGLAGAYAGFLLAELGADVHAAQPAGGPVLDRRKRAAAAPANVDAVLRDADAPAVAGAAPVRCRLSAWGQRGPRRHLPPDEALLAAATGVQSLQWSWSGRPVWMVTPMI